MNHTYAHIRGFNYQPSWGSCGLETFGPDFDTGVVAAEMARGKRHFPGINTLRIWLSHQAFLRYGAAAFLVHLLHHTLVADGHRPEYGPLSTAGYMACIEADGTLRQHHEVFNEFEYRK